MAGIPSPFARQQSMVAAHARQAADAAAAAQPLEQPDGAAIKIFCSVPRHGEVPISVAVSILDPRVLLKRRFLQVSGGDPVCVCAY